MLAEVTNFAYLLKYPFLTLRPIGLNFNDPVFALLTKISKSHFIISPLNYLQNQYLLQITVRTRNNIDYNNFTKYYK